MAIGRTSNAAGSIKSTLISTIRSSSKNAKALAKELLALGKPTHTLISSLSLTTPEEASSGIMALWNSSTTTYPQLLDTAECWTTVPPPTATLMLATLDLIEEKKKDPTVAFTTWRRGAKDSMDPRIAVIQLAEPNASNPSALIGINLELLPEGSFEAPIALSEFVDSWDVSEQSLLLTPKFWYSDLHLDSADGISAPMGACVKIWITFPPTKKNLALMAQAEGQKAKLTRIGKQLEGGMIFRTDSSQAIYLPVGTLHAVYTVVGGFLIGVDLTTPTSSRTYAAMMEAGLTSDGDFERACYDRFLLSVDVGLDNNQIALSIQAWMDAEDHTREYAARHLDWAQDGVAVWEEFLAKGAAKKDRRCPCGKMKKGGSFVAHFRTEHAVKIPGGKKRKGSGAVEKKRTKERR